MVVSAIKLGEDLRRQPAQDIAIELPVVNLELEKTGNILMLLYLSP